MGNGTRAQFREQNKKIKIDTHTYTHTHHTSWFPVCCIFSPCKRSLFSFFLFKLAHNQVKSQKGMSLSARATTKHRLVHHVNLTSTETLAGSGSLSQRSARLHKEMELLQKTCFPITPNIQKKQDSKCESFIPTKQYREGTDAAFRSRLEKWNSKAGDVLFCLLSVECGFMWREKWFRSRLTLGRFDLFSERCWQ